MFLSASEHAYKCGNFSAENLNDQPIKQLWLEISKNFNDVLLNGLIAKLPQDIIHAFKSNIYIFSGMKTYEQMRVLSQYMLSEDGHNIRSFSELKSKALQINEQYNVNYLETEYNFAIHSAQSASHWHSFDSNAILQYRTAGDERVRHSHAIINRTTLPKSSPFWDKYYTPNGWNCRCNVLEVPQDTPLSDYEKAIANGEKATTQISKNGENALEIFRFNPGKSGTIFPPKHPYLITNGASQDKKQALKIVSGTTNKIS